MRFIVFCAIAFASVAAPADAFCGPFCGHWRTHRQRVQNSDGSVTTVTVETPLFLPRVRQPKITVNQSGPATGATR